LRALPAEIENFDSILASSAFFSAVCCGFCCLMATRLKIHRFE
jgi:hypothetical protein